MRSFLSMFMGFAAGTLLILAATGTVYAQGKMDRLFFESQQTVNFVANWMMFLVTLLIFVMLLFDSTGRIHRNKAHCMNMFCHSAVLIFWTFSLCRLYGVFVPLMPTLQPYLPQVFKYGPLPYWGCLSLVLNLWLLMQVCNNNKMTKEQYHKEILKI